MDYSNSHNNKLHHYMITTQITYIRTEEIPDGTGRMDAVEVPKKKTMNAILTNNKKLITYDVLNEGRKAVLQRAHDEYGIEVKDVKDYLYLNIVYMGLMTEDEFQGKPAKKARIS